MKCIFKDFVSLTFFDVVLSLNLFDVEDKKDGKKDFEIESRDRTIKLLWLGFRA